MGMAEIRAEMEATRGELQAKQRALEEERVELGKAIAQVKRDERQLVKIMARLEPEAAKVDGEEEGE